MLDMAFHGDDAAEHGVVFRIGRRPSLQVLAAIGEAEEEGRAALAEPGRHGLAFIDRKMARMQLDAIEVHELPVELPLLVRIADPFGIAFQLRFGAPEGQGVAEADVAIDAAGRLDAGLRVVFAVGFGGGRGTQGSEREQRGKREHGDLRAHRVGPHFEAWRKATMSRISGSLRMALVPKGGISVSGLRVRMS